MKLWWKECVYLFVCAVLKLGVARENWEVVETEIGRIFRGDVFNVNSWYHSQTFLRLEAERQQFKLMEHTSSSNLPAIDAKGSIIPPSSHLDDNMKSKDSTLRVHAPPIHPTKCGHKICALMTASSTAHDIIEQVLSKSKYGGFAVDTDRAVGNVPTSRCLYKYQGQLLEEYKSQKGYLTRIATEIKPEVDKIAIIGPHNLDDLEVEQPNASLLQALKAATVSPSRGACARQVLGRCGHKVCMKMAGLQPDSDRVTMNRSKLFQKRGDAQIMKMENNGEQTRDRQNDDDSAYFIDPIDKNPSDDEDDFEDDFGADLEQSVHETAETSSPKWTPPYPCLLERNRRMQDHVDASAQLRGKRAVFAHAKLHAAQQLSSRLSKEKNKDKIDSPMLSRGRALKSPSHPYKAIPLHKRLYDRSPAISAILPTRRMNLEKLEESRLSLKASNKPETLALERAKTKTHKEHPEPEKAAMLRLPFPPSSPAPSRTAPRAKLRAKKPLTFLISGGDDFQQIGIPSSLSVGRDLELENEVPSNRQQQNQAFLDYSI